MAPTKSEVAETHKVQVEKQESNGLKILLNVIKPF